MEITRGKIQKAKKVVIYGPEGIGKSTFAARFPGAVFIDTEGSTNDMDVARLPRPTSWNMLFDEIEYIKTHTDECRTLVIDTVDWAELLCVEHICAVHNKKGIEDFGYGNGYVYTKEEFGRFLNKLSDLIEVGINVVLTAHAQLRKFEQPDELGAYDRWELKLGKKTQSQTSPLVKEWADMLLFANYKTFSVAVEAFDKDQYNVLCNSMLLTEGWDCPSVDCIVVLRPTKVRSLYCQMVGRGTRLSPETNKDHLLLLDFLWHTERHELCHPASLICESAEVAQKMTENMEKDAGCVIDIEEAEKTASEDVVAQREEALAKQLSEIKRRKKRLVDPLQFEMSIQAEDLSGYVPAFGWEMAPPSDGQKKTLEKLGILPDAIENAGKASKILDRLDKRRREGLTTPKQIRFLESRGFQHVGTWQFETAKNMIDRIAGNGWRVPSGIIPAEYRG